jgi:hypothetical protein
VMSPVRVMGAVTWCGGADARREERHAEDGQEHRASAAGSAAARAAPHAWGPHRLPQARCPRRRLAPAVRAPGDGHRWRVGAKLTSLGTVPGYTAAMAS